MRVVRSSHFVPGPVNLGRWGTTVGLIAVTWVAFVAVVLNMPTVNPNPWVPTLFNWAPVMAGGVLFIATVYWFVSARKWFKGPQLDTVTAGAWKEEEQIETMFHLEKE